MGMRELLAAMRVQANGTEPVSLVLAGRRQVKFSGLRGAQGPLTVGQSNTLHWIRDETEWSAPRRPATWRT